MSKLPVDLEEWPPALAPPKVTIGEMLQWHDEGCEWPVSGDANPRYAARLRFGYTRKIGGTA
jgi:hypothetical protein